MHVGTLTALPLALLLSGGMVLAEAPLGAVTTEAGHFAAEAARGAELRPRVLALTRLLRARRFEEATTLASALREDYERLFDRTLHQYTFHTARERDEFARTSSAPFEWIDWGYAECLQSLAFIAADERRFDAALALLHQVEAVAPISAGVAAEAGYVLNQLRRNTAALAAYRRALDLARKFPSQVSFAAIALRGQGVALIELERLDEAEAVLRESLRLEPASTVAHNELDYIRHLREVQAGE